MQHAAPSNNPRHSHNSSFVTLTTLGYGDISPNTPFAQVAVYMEAIAGVFYMAIVVASLVSAGLAQKETQQEG